MSQLTVVAHLPARHAAHCAIHDPTPDYCTCGARAIPLVTLADAKRAIADTHPAPAPQQVPMTDEQITQMYDAEVDIDPEASWEAYHRAVRSYEARIGITAQAKGGA